MDAGVDGHAHAHADDHDHDHDYDYVDVYEDDRGRSLDEASFVRQA